MKRTVIKIACVFLGGITLLMFLVTAVTYVLLMFYYRPTPEYAYTDVQYLEFDIPFGMQLRNIHHWATHGMVISVIIIIFFALVVYLASKYETIILNKK